MCIAPPDMGVAGGRVIVSRLVDIGSRPPPVVEVKIPVGVIVAAAMSVIAVPAAVSAMITGAAAMPAATQPPVLDLNEGIVHLKTRLGDER